MTFERWLADHVGDDGDLGDLARQVAADPGWPPHAGRHEQRAHMERCGACTDEITVHRDAWRQYRQETGR